jgi:hypothetical protein
MCEPKDHQCKCGGKCKCITPCATCRCHQQSKEECRMLEASDRAEANRETPLGEQLDGNGEMD